MSVTLRPTDDSDLTDIYAGGDCIGYIRGDTDYLSQFEIYPTYRAHGYGKASLNAVVERARQKGNTSVETGAVVSPAMDWILRCPQTPPFQRIQPDTLDEIRYRVRLEKSAEGGDSPRNQDHTQ